MTTAAINVTLGGSLKNGAGLPNGDFSSSVGMGADAAGLSSTVQTDATTADTDVGTVVTDATAADTDVGTVQTDLATAFTAYNIFGNALVAITGDSFSNTTHLWTTGGSTGLTHAQVVTLMGDLNTAITDFITAQTAAGTAKTATALTLTDANTAKTATAAAKTAAVSLVAALSADAVLVLNLATVTTGNGVRAILKKILHSFPGFGIVTGQ